MRFAELERDLKARRVSICALLLARTRTWDDGSAWCGQITIARQLWL